jgi:D-glycero-alpha-D-manno-heptose 1-phosphate guanylyltransferase
MILSNIPAVVLVGGLGTRIRHLLPDLPKPMAPVAGKPFLDWLVRFLGRQGIRKVIFSTGYLAQTVENHFVCQPVTGVLTRCIPEPEPLGTAGGFLNAVRLSRETPDAWLVLNGDSLAFADLTLLTRALDDPATAGALVGREVPDASRYGTLALGGDGELLGFQEKHPGKGIISAGIYLLRSSLVNEFPVKVPLSFETDVFPHLLRRGLRLKISVQDVPFLDIGTPESLREAESFIAENRNRF